MIKYMPGRLEYLLNQSSGNFPAIDILGSKQTKHYFALSFRIIFSKSALFPASW